MGKLELQQMVLGPVYTNCYIAKNKETGEALIIDPADSPSKIELKVNAMGAEGGRYGGKAGRNPSDSWTF